MNHLHESVFSVLEPFIQSRIFHFRIHMRKTEKLNWFREYLQYLIISSLYVTQLLHLLNVTFNMYNFQFFFGSDVETKGRKRTPSEKKTCESNPSSIFKITIFFQNQFLHPTSLLIGKKFNILKKNDAT